MRKKKVALVVGHRKRKPGAYGNAGLSEFQYNSILVNDIFSSLLGSDDVDVRIFYRDDKPGGYGEKMKRLHKRIDAWGADFSISFHFNACDKTWVNGHEILYCSNAGRRAAKILDKHFDKNLNNRDRNIKRRKKNQRGGGFLCRGRSVCVISEPFFASHQDKFVRGTDGYEVLKKSYIDAIKEI